MKLFLEQCFRSIDKVKGDCMSKSMGQVMEAGPQAAADYFIGIVWPDSLGFSPELPIDR